MCTVGVTDRPGLVAAIELAQQFGADVLLEQRSEGEDLRIIVIDGTVVAASVRRPPKVVGDGEATVEQLIESLDSKRAAATDGSSRIAIDEVTTGVVEAAGHDLSTVLDDGVELLVRRTANLHTGGTIHDVTDVLHPELAGVAVRAAEAIGIPVLGLDLMVPSPDGPDYVIIEANEQPGLANHEPQPTAERFIDLLFPETAAVPDTARRERRPDVASGCECGADPLAVDDRGVGPARRHAVAGPFDRDPADRPARGRATRTGIGGTARTIQSASRLDHRPGRVVLEQQGRPSTAIGTHSVVCTIPFASARIHQFSMSSVMPRSWPTTMPGD